jgi:hypothetical protein
VRRHILGLIAIAALLAAAVFCFYPPLEQYKALAGPGVRIGSVLAVLWLAWPDLHRLPQWTWYALPLALLALIWARPMLIYLAPVLGVALAAYVLYRKVWRSPR